MQQQGDVLIKKIKSLPEKVSLKKTKGVLILAEGEVTGHAHRIKSDKANLYEHNGMLYLKVKEDVELTHEEHKTQVINPGIYEIGIVKEYDYIMEMERNIAD